MQVGCRLPSANFLCRIHERTFSLRFLGIILRVLKLEVSVWISQTIGMGVWFFIRGFLLSPLQCTVTALETKRLREFEEV
jgi:hypothetical protein